MDIFKKRKYGKRDPFDFGEERMSDSRLADDRNLEWVEEGIEIGVLGKENGADEGGEKSREFMGLALGAKRLTLFLFFIFGILLVLTGKTAYLQIIKGNYYHDIAEGNRIRTVAVRAERGIVYDKNLNPLVKNIPSFSLYLIPSDFPSDQNERLATVGQLAALAKIEPKEIEDKLEEGIYRSYTPVLLKENIEYEEAILLKIESALIPGVELKLESRRDYMKGGNDSAESISHLLGYVGKINKEELEQNKDYTTVDSIGKMGLERFYEDFLRGKNGKKEIEVDALGKEKAVIAQEDPVRGKNIILSLDTDVQKKLEDILGNHLRAAQKTRAAAVALNPQNGEILALVSLPAFDNNLFAHGISTEDYQFLINNPDKPLFNRAVMGEYPSGSTIKPVIAAAALEEGIINKNTSFQSTGGLRVSSWFFPDWLSGGHGWANVTRAIAESINTFFYIIGGGYEDFEGLGVNRIVEYAKLFGFGERLGIDLPNEADGFLPSKEWKEETKGEQWYIGDTYHLSIGQGDIAVTPLQIAASTAVFGNGGTLYRPHFLHAVETEDSPVNPDDYIIRKDFIKKENVDIIRAGMRQTIVSGSGVKLQDLPVTSAGKTGTAQWATDEDPHAWFTGFAPYENPEIIITVLVEEGVEGSRISLDISREFLQWYFSR